jgi:hypothetical protein
MTKDQGRRTKGFPIAFVETEFVGNAYLKGIAARTVVENPRIARIGANIKVAFNFVHIRDLFIGVYATIDALV